MLGQTVLRQVELYPRITDEADLKSALERFRGHLNDIAGDSGGSKPKDYVSESDIAFFGRLKAAADRYAAEHQMDPPGWKGATPITHKETTPRWLPGRPKKTDGIVRDAEGNPVVGYRVGYLNNSQFEAPVLFCSDGTLRMLIKHSDAKDPHLRGAYAGKSFAGYCRLPDPALLYPVRSRGTMSGVSYNHGQTDTLKTDLEERTGYKFD
jgi:hypothetical protein